MENVCQKLENLCQNGSKIYAKTMKKQVRKFDGKSAENMMVSDGAKPRLALYSCVILHIGYFRKRERKCDGKSMQKLPKIHQKIYKK